MNPGLLEHFHHHKTLSILRSQESSKKDSAEDETSTPYFPSHSTAAGCDQGTKGYRRIFPHLPVVHGPLIPPGGSLARAVMGNSNSCHEIGAPSAGIHESSSPATQSHFQSAENDPTEPSMPSNLTAMLDQQQRQGREASPTIISSVSLDTSEGSKNLGFLLDEADSASGPPPLRLANIASDPASLLRARSMTPPGFIPSAFNQPALGSNVDVSTALRANGARFTGKVRR
jgi:hypothetical protein